MICGGDNGILRQSLCEYLLMYLITTVKPDTKMMREPYRG